METAGEIGRTLAGMIREELACRSDAEQRIIANRVREAIAAWIVAEAVPTATIAPMTDAESLAFEKLTLRFGRHTGKAIRDIPRDYLAWLADDNRKTWRRLAAYLRSRRVQAEAENSDALVDDR